VTKLAVAAPFFACASEYTNEGAVERKLRHAVVRFICHEHSLLLPSIALEQDYAIWAVKLTLISSIPAPEGADELQVCAGAVCTNH
jgi:hypothetical protein